MERHADGGIPGSLPAGFRFELQYLFEALPGDHLLEGLLPFIPVLTYHEVQVVSAVADAGRGVGESFARTQTA
ncbi:hypothetical protein [Thermodesulfitimonas autotrophica]|uniref:hypothetical protein n=1 Tax=Thermodesulfitimonas autotrophica TaxID=1894989 RepID=UPI002FE0018C